MKHFYVITNNQKDPDRTTTKKIRTYLEKRGCTCEVQEQSEQGDIRTDASKIPGETQGILVLGGDGTILQASRDTVELEIPVIGVNLGKLGYLAEIEQNRLEEALERLVRTDAARGRKLPRVAVMGCVVNGPGEAKGADVALCGGAREFLLYVGGRPAGKVRPEDAVAAVLSAVRGLMSEEAKG